MENVQYAIEILDKWGVPIKNFERDIDRISRKKVKDPFSDIPKSISRLKIDLARLKASLDATTRTDHRKKYNLLIEETEKRIRSLERSTATCATTSNGFFSKLKSNFGISPWMIAAAAVAGGIKKMSDFAGESVKAAAQVEKYNVTLKTMLGSQGSARDRMTEYSDIAMKTPFELNQVVEAGNQLQAIGRYSRNNLTMLGDLAAASGKPLEQVLGAYAKISTGQKGEGVNMFRDLLISTDDWIKATGKGISKNGELIATTEEMLAALPQIMKSKGFTGMMEEQSRTTEGQVSNLKDAIFQLKVATGERMKPAFNDFLRGSKSIVETMKGWVEIPLPEKIAREKAELNSLVGIITNANTGEEQRKSLLQQLQQQYPDFLANMDLETVKNQELLDKLNGVNTAYERKMQLASQKDFFSKEEDEYKELQEEYVRRITYASASAERNKLQKWFIKQGVVYPENQQGVNGAEIFNANLDKLYKASQAAIGLNPKNKKAAEIINKYLEYKGQDMLAANTAYGFSGMSPEKIIEIEEKMRLKKSSLDILARNLTTEERKDLYTQAQSINLKDNSTYEKLFNSKNLANEFDALRKKTFEVLKDDEWERLSGFLSGSLKYVKSPGGSGSGTGSVDMAADAISGGGKSVKQVIIHLNSGLIETNNNYFDKTQDPKDASDFMSKLTNALASVVNDVNYSV
ncbi:MAG TPA: hypothetical protein PLC48_08960 [Ferruginibacter sp.]|nr:hypothetical protein [Ferruginibacter sp.]